MEVMPLGLKVGVVIGFVQKVLSVTDTMCCGVDTNIDIENSISVT